MPTSRFFPGLLVAALLGCGGGAPSERPAPADRRPNVLLIVVDTLRADHLTPYGYPRDTSPRIEELLARRGVVLERAWAQAPWTLPSAVSYMTGRYPGELLTDDLVEFGIPPGVPSLAERFRDLGYRTAGFYANPTLHAGNGFARGFEVFYTPPATVESLRLHGETVTERAVPWLRAHADEPFFAYLHYIDPHDPYLSPVVEQSGATPFDPDYAGRVTGEWPHALFSGTRRLPDPERDLRHLVALYDSEIRHVDGEISRVLAALPPEVLADTLVVLTSDHGEELHDHGGWKHGQTLYEEQLHVPLIVRWDRRLPAGHRVGAPVELVDLAPTLLAAAGDGAVADAGGELDGRDLLGLLAGGAEPPPRAGFAQQLAGGPQRSAIRLGGWKLALFDREAPYRPPDALQAALYAVDRERLRRIELYDLRADPGERRNLAAERPETVRRLARSLMRRLDGQGRPGLRLALTAPAGARLTGEIRFDRAPEGWRSDFLAAGDRVELAGAVLRLDWRSEGWPKGIRVLGEPAGIAAIELSLDGRPVLPGRVLAGAGRWRGGEVPAAALETTAWPPDSALRRSARAGSEPAPVLALWRPAAPPPAAATAGDEAAEESARRLRALGYIE